MRGHTQQVFDPEKVVLRPEGLERWRKDCWSLRLVLCDICRHKTVQYLLVLLSEDQMNDNYVTHPSVCEINL